MSRSIEAEDGIVIVAHSKASYLAEAATLARSIRRFSPTVPIALITNFDIPDRTSRTAGFSRVVQCDFTSFPGLEFKLHLETLSPFSGSSLFLDSDSICYGDISPVFTAFSGKEFVALGKPLKACHWFQNAARTMESFGIHQFPFFCGDFYLFRRTPLAQQVFASAREIAGRYDALGINRLGGILNDEPVLSLAMAKHGIEAEPFGPRWILQMQAQQLDRVVLDWTMPLAQAVLAEHVVSPILVHFQAHRTMPLYFRERFLVHAWGTGWMSRNLARTVGITQSLASRATISAKKYAASHRRPRRG